MEQAFPATDNTWPSFVWARFRKGEIAFLNRTLDRDGLVNDGYRPGCICHWCEDNKPTWAEKVNVLLHRVPVYDARFRGCEVTHWRVPFGWIPAQPGDAITFPNSHNVYFS